MIPQAIIFSHFCWQCTMAIWIIRQVFWNYSYILFIKHM